MSVPLPSNAFVLSGFVLVDCEKQKREINLIMSLRNKGTKYKDIKFKLEKYTGRKWHHSFLVKLIKRHEDNWIIKTKKY